MKAIQNVSYQCECGGPINQSGDGTYLYCPNEDCPNRGKKFKVPTIELEEL